MQQDLFYLRYHIALIGKGHLVPDRGKDDIAGPAEIHDHRYGARRESFEHYARTVVTKGWKNEHVRGSHAAESLSMAEPAAEGNSLLDSKGSCELLKAGPFRAITDHGEPG
jgi:hypothetical protein